MLKDVEMQLDTCLKLSDDYNWLNPKLMNKVVKTIVEDWRVENQQIKDAKIISDQNMKKQRQELKKDKIFVKIGWPFTGWSQKPMIQVKQEVTEIPIEE